MQAMVMPLGQLAPESFGLFWLQSDGRIGLKLGTSWSDAAEKAREELAGLEVLCDPALATVGRRFNWASREPTPEQHLERAAVAVGLANDLDPRDHDHTLALVIAWVDFFRLRLWEQMPAEMSLRTLLRRKGASEEGCLAVLGQAGQEFGLAWYEDWRAFDAIWSGEPYLINGLSVLADDSRFLAPAFEPFGVPPLVLMKIVNTTNQPPDGPTCRLAAAALELTLDVLRPEGPQTRNVGEGVTIELKRGGHADEPPRRKRAPAKKKTTKKKK